MVVVASNVSTECWVVNIPANAASLTADSAEAEDFVVEEPDDEKYFTMVDKGTFNGLFLTFCTSFLVVSN